MTQAVIVTGIEPLAYRSQGCLAVDCKCPGIGLEGLTLSKLRTGPGSEDEPPFNPFPATASSTHSSGCRERIKSQCQEVGMNIPLLGVASQPPLE